MVSTRALLNGTAMTLARPGVRTHVELARPGGEKRRVHVRTETAVPDALLRANRKRGGRRAPLGDSHGAWEKCAELPLALVLQHIPPDAWDDERAWQKLLNDPQFKAFRCDGGRTY